MVPFLTNANACAKAAMGQCFNPAILVVSVQCWVLGSSGGSSLSPFLVAAVRHLGSGRAPLCDRGLTESFRKKASLSYDFILY